MHYLCLLVTAKKPQIDGDRVVGLRHVPDRGDWYQVGGRFTGHLDGYEPDKDPANIRPCEFCEATGVTTEAVAVKYPAYADAVGKTCIQCKGEGKRPVWPTNYAPHAGDSMPAKDAAEFLLKSGGSGMPYVVRMNVGEYRGDVVFGFDWGEEPTEEKKVEQEAKWKEMLAYAVERGCWITVLDCHS